MRPDRIVMAPPAFDDIGEKRLQSASSNLLVILGPARGNVRHQRIFAPSPITSSEVLAIPNRLGRVRRVGELLNTVEDDNRADRDNGRRNASGDEDTHGVLGFLVRPQERSYRGPVYGLHSPS